MPNHNRRSKQSKSSPSRNLTIASDDQPWVVRLGPEFINNQLTPLSSRVFRLVVGLDSLARMNPFLWHDNDKIGPIVGLPERSLKEAFMEAEEEGVRMIERVYFDPKKRHRAGIIMLRRVGPDTPAADTPERIAECREALLRKWRPNDFERSYPMRNPAYAVCGFPHTDVCGFPPQNKEELWNKDEPEEGQALELSVSPSSSCFPTETTLCAGADDDDDQDRYRDLERLRDKLDGITEQGAGGKLLRDRITDCARWMASRLMDDHSHKMYCKMLNRLPVGSLTPFVVLQAFEAAYVKMIENEVGVMGAFFFRSIDSIQSRAVTDAEILEEHATLPMPAVGAYLPADDADHDRRPAGGPEIVQEARPEIPESHWVLGVRDRATGLLREQAGRGTFSDGKRLEKVAGLIQAELAGKYSGHGSRLFLALVEAVAFGYPLEAVAALLLAAGRVHNPGVRVDIKDCIRTLDPDPRDWLRANVSDRDRFFDLTRKPADALLR